MAKSKNHEVFDITVVGAGPTGLFGAFYAGMREMSCKLIDALPQAGGQITALYPEKKIFDTPGFPSIVGKDLVVNLVEQANHWDTNFALGERAETLRRVPLPGGEPDSRGLRGEASPDPRSRLRPRVESVHGPGTGARALQRVVPARGIFQVRHWRTHGH